MIFIRRVVGTSMLPALKPGKIVIGLGFRRPRIGDIVIVDRDGRELIKRIAQIGPAGYYLLGDNRDNSTDSRVFGWIKPAMIKAVIIRKAHRGHSDTAQ